MLIARPGPGHVSFLDIEDYIVPPLTCFFWFSVALIAKCEIRPESRSYLARAFASLPSPKMDQGGFHYVKNWVGFPCSGSVSADQRGHVRSL